MIDPRLADCRRLFVRGLELQMRIGAHEHERHAPQRVRVEVDVWVPLAQSTPRRDRLDEVVDYNFIREAALALAARGHTDLQETLCDALARALLGRPHVRAVRVATDKPDVYPDCASVGVEVFHFKDDPLP